MLRRSMSVVFKPLKNNYVILPESYFRLVAPYINGCLTVTYNYEEVIHLTWAPYPGTSNSLHDTEIGMNATAANALGIKEGGIVKCLLVPDATQLKQVFVSPITKKDWEMIELSSTRVQSTLLEQTKVLNKGQKLVVWLNKSITITLKVDKLNPDVPFGRIENNTELIVSPFEGSVERIKEVKKANRNSLLEPHLNGKYELNNSLSSSSLTNGHHALSKSSTLASVKTYQGVGESKLEALQELRKLLSKETSKIYEFRVIQGEWNKSNHINDVFIKNTQNFDFDRVYLLKLNNNGEYLVNVKILPKEKESDFPDGVYPSIEVNKNLMIFLGMREFEKVTLRPKNTVLNFIDRIEIHPNRDLQMRQLREIEHSFKQFILDQSKFGPILLNQDQIVPLKSDDYVTIKLAPETFKYCLIDVDILTESKIKLNDQAKSIDKFFVEATEDQDIQPDISLPENHVKIEKYEELIKHCVDRLKFSLCLDNRNSLFVTENFLLIGPTNAGKSIVCDQILDQVLKKPFCCYFDVFYCSRSKGRKPESVMKDLRHCLVACASHSPSILLLDNLDGLAKNAAENTQDGEYYNKVSEVIKSLIKEFTTSNPISVIATVANLNNLNRRVYSSRGEHLFQNVIKLPELETANREFIIKKLCNQMSCSKRINWKKLAILTEGYKLGDLVQFVEKSIFTTYKGDPKFPTLTENILTETLKITNTYCLQGIENNSLDECDEEVSDKIPGLENAIEVMEEVIMWPSKYLSIFQDSPLRNQAGVLLYGPPGTGKTYLVGQLAKAWNLRMISVKGPELLAKYIGQSEENVRNLFEKARSTKPCVLFFDEFDSLAPRRGHDSTGVTDRVVNQLLTELDGVESLQGVTVIGATSRPELLDPALLRSGRIDRFVECSLPNAISRLEIFRKMCRSLKLAKDVDLEYFSSKADNFTGADIKSVITTANMTAIKEFLAKNDDIPDAIPIQQRHIEEAFENTRPSLSPQDIQKYKKTYAVFTNKEKPSRDFVAKRATLA